MKIFRIISLFEILIIVIIAVTYSSAQSGNGSFGEPCPKIPNITDSRDGQTYPTVKIGSQCWLKKNMNYQTGNSWCYDNNSDNCETYGRLYDWQTALLVCPTGWHLPSDYEWCILTQYIDPTVNCNVSENFSGNVAGLRMKSTYGWTNNRNGNNRSGFTALPSGLRSQQGDFQNLTITASFWTSSKYSSTYFPSSAYYRALHHQLEGIGRGDYLGIQTRGFSVRCLKD